MPERYNFSTCCRLLSTNPKTFKGWLEKANIDSSKQVNAADPREKYLTLKQVQQLADQHGRILPPLTEDEEAAAPPLTLEALAEQLAATHTQTTTLIETTHALLTEMTQSFRHILSLVQEQGEHRQRFDQVEQSVEEPTVNAVPAVQSGLEEAPSSSALSTPTTSATTKRKSTHTASRSSKKAKGKGKFLPRTLVPLRVFADQHQIEMNVADRASESGKITAVRGKWLYNSRIVAKALDARGQCTFYKYFSIQKGFTRCEQCPHGAQEDSEDVSLAG